MQTKKEAYHKSISSSLKIDECPNCHNKDIIFEPTMTYCNNCGLVLQGIPEWHDIFKTHYPFGVKL